MTSHRQIGSEIWDPIGGGVPEDEYDTYLLKAAGDLWNGEGLDRVAACLASVETRAMGLGDAPGVHDRALEAASAIHRYVQSLRD